MRAPTAPLSTRDAERLRYVAAAGGWSIRLATSSGVLVAERADRSLYGRTERELADTIANSAAKGKK